MDSSALLAFLREETDAEVVARIFAEGREETFAHAINLCEVYYDTCRERGEEYAEHVMTKLAGLGLQISEHMDPTFWRQAGQHKAIIRRLSLADCFCLALAERLEARIITKDHEFDPVAQQGIADIQFIR